MKMYKVNFIDRQIELSEDAISLVRHFTNKRFNQIYLGTRGEQYINVIVGSEKIQDDFEFLYYFILFLEHISFKGTYIMENTLTALASKSDKDNTPVYLNQLERYFHILDVIYPGYRLISGIINPSKTMYGFLTRYSYERIGKNIEYDVINVTSQFLLEYIFNKEYNTVLKQEGLRKLYFSLACKFESDEIALSLCNLIEDTKHVLGNIIYYDLDKVFVKFLEQNNKKDIYNILNLNTDKIDIQICTYNAKKCFDLIVSYFEDHNKEVNLKRIATYF